MSQTLIVLRAFVRPFLYLIGGYVLGRYILGPLIILMITGCASSGLYQMSDRWCAEHPNASEHRCAGYQLAHAKTYCQYGEHPAGDRCFGAAQSWDQESLKANDHGCPTAIFIAPDVDGNLEQCP